MIVELAAAAALLGTAKVVRPTDLVDVVDTRVACIVEDAGGLRQIGCFLAGRRGPLPRTFGAVLAEDGTATLLRVEPGGRLVSVAKRAPQSRARQRRVRVAAGDTVLVAGTDVSCSVSAIGLSCARSDGRGPLPRTHGVVLTERAAAIVRYDGRRRAKTVTGRSQR